MTAFCYCFSVKFESGLSNNYFPQDSKPVDNAKPNFALSCKNTFRHLLVWSHAVYWFLWLANPQERKVSDVYQVWIKPWLTGIYQTCPAGPGECRRVWRFMKLPRIFCAKKIKKDFFKKKVVDHSSDQKLWFLIENLLEQLFQIKRKLMFENTLILSVFPGLPTE